MELFSSFLRNNEMLYSFFGKIDIEIFLAFVEKHYRDIISLLGDNQLENSSIQIFKSNINFKTRRYLVNRSRIEIITEKIDPDTLAFNMEEIHMIKEQMHHNTTKIVNTFFLEWNNTKKVLRISDMEHMLYIQNLKTTQIFIKKFLLSKLPMDIIRKIFQYLYYYEFFNLRILPII